MLLCCMSGPAAAEHSLATQKPPCCCGACQTPSINCQAVVTLQAGVWHFLGCCCQHCPGLQLHLSVPWSSGHSGSAAHQLLCGAHCPTRSQSDSHSQCPGQSCILQILRSFVWEVLLQAKRHMRCLMALLGSSASAGIVCMWARKMTSFAGCFAYIRGDASLLC